MATISKVIKPFCTKFYSVNIGMENNYFYYEEHIGEVLELTYRYHSDYSNAFVFGKPHKDNIDDWQYAMEIGIEDNMSMESFEKYLNKLNKEDKFHQYFINKKTAEQVGIKSKRDYDNHKWTLDSLLSAIKNDSELTSLRYNYHIAQVKTQVESKAIESIYVSSNWRILLIENKILVQRSGWRTYEVPNLPSLFKVLEADTDSYSDETIRQIYSIV